MGWGPVSQGTVRPDRVVECCRHRLMSTLPRAACQTLPVPAARDELHLDDVYADGFHAVLIAPVGRSLSGTVV